MDINALGAVADLAAVDEARAFDGVHGEVDIGIGEHDGGGLAAEFEVHLRDIFRGGGHDARAGGHAAGEADEADAGALGEGLSDTGASAGEDVDEAGR